jgi:hypothetical protein
MAIGRTIMRRDHALWDVEGLLFGVETAKDKGGNVRRDLVSLRPCSFCVGLGYISWIRLNFMACASTHLCRLSRYLLLLFSIMPH